MDRDINHVKSNHNIKWGAILTYITLVFSLLNGLILTPVILKFAGSSNYGFYSFTLSITTWLPVLTNALTASFIRFASLDDKNLGAPKRIVSIYFKIISLFCLLAVAVFLSVLCILFFSNVSLGQYTLSENHLIYFLLLLSSINSFSSIFFSFFTLFVNFRQRFIYVEVVKLLTAFLGFVLKIILVIFTKRIEIVLIIDIVLTISFGLLTFLFAKFKLSMPIDIRTSLIKNKIIVKEIIIFSSFLLLNNLAEQINNHLDVTILGLFTDSESVTTYQLSFTFCSYMANIPVAIATLFIPRINEYYARGETNKINSLFLKVSHLQCLFVFLILGGYVSCGRDFIRLWLSGQRDDVFYYSLPLLFIHSLPLTVNVAIEIQRAYNKHKFRAISLLLIAIVNALTSATCVLLLPKQYAVLACVLCTVISKFVGVWILFNVYNYKVIKLPIISYIKDASALFIKTFLCAFIALAFSSFLHNNNVSTLVSFLATGSIFVLAYFFGVIINDKEAISFLRKKK